MRLYQTLLFALAALVALVAVALHVHRTQPLAVHLSASAYIWQRQWTPAVTAAISQSDAAISRWHVFAGELDQGDHWITPAIDAPALIKSGKPLVAVLRIDGQRSQLDVATVLRGVQQMRDNWRAAGLHPSGIELDYDCPTSALPAYTALLSTLHQQLPGDLPLSITALPTWLSSPALPALLAQANDVTLQIHAVLNPHHGLFDPARAEDWLQHFAALRHGPWQVALPAYGSRVGWDEQGHIIAIESEQSGLLGDTSATELIADPVVIAAFMQRIEQQALPGLHGWLWFRLPVAGDRRAWSMGSWLAVLRHQTLRSQIEARVQPDASRGLYQINLRNLGTIDATLPAGVRIHSECNGTADGINGYTLEADASGSWLRREQAGLLPVAQTRAIGWVRCNQGVVTADVLAQQH